MLKLMDSVYYAGFRFNRPGWFVIANIDDVTEMLYLIESDGPNGPMLTTNTARCFNVFSPKICRRYDGTTRGQFMSESTYRHFLLAQHSIQDTA